MIATEIKDFGQVIKEEHFKLVHVNLPQGKVIPAHDNLDHDHEIYFTSVRGEVKTLLDGVEEHRLSPGTVLSFPGEATISIEALVDSEFFVSLVKRP